MVVDDGGGKFLYVYYVNDNKEVVSMETFYFTLTKFYITLSLDICIIKKCL